MRLIEGVVFTTRSINPISIAELIMGFPALPMLGCQHAYIAGGALMAALRNEGTVVLTEGDIREVFSRVQKQAHGGFCGLTGICGVLPAIGACFSVLLGSKCGMDEEQRLTMEAVSRVSRAITDLTGPSCCKAYVRAALAVAIGFLKHSFAIDLPGPTERVCNSGAVHPHGCRKKRCPYFTAPENLEERQAE